jgi:hypothetical protein
MGECEFMGTCPFFNNKTSPMPANAEELKNNYCKTNNLHCALYMIASSLGAEKFPLDVLPIEKDKAYAIIAQG